MSAPLSLGSKIPFQQIDKHFEKKAGYVRCYHCFKQSPRSSSYIVDVDKRIYVCSNHCLVAYGQFIEIWKKIR